MTTSIPTVSILLTSYNHEKFIREAIDSVLGQTYSDFELIIWDDASTDSSWDIIQSYDDPRIKAFRNGVNERKVINKILLSGQVRGHYVAIHHSDDVWEPEKLEKQVAFLDENPHYGAVFTRAFSITESGMPFEDTTHLYYSVFDQPNRTRHEWLRFFFAQGNALCHPSMLIRKECYDTCGVYSYTLAQVPDFDLWIRLAMRYELYVLPEKLVRFRVRDHEANISGNRRDTRILVRTEYFKVLEHFKGITDLDDLLRILPEARSYDRGEHTDVQFVLGRVGLEIVRLPFAQLFCLGLLYDALADPRRRKTIAEEYGFTYRSLMGLSKGYDVFSQEDLREMSLRAWGKLVYTGLYLFDEGGGLIRQYMVEMLLGNENTICFELDEEGPFHSFRWDPIEGSPCRVFTQSIMLTNDRGTTTSIPIDEMQHNGEPENDGIRFYTNDPQQKYFFSGNAKRIEITARVEKLDPFVVESKLSQRVFELQDKNGQYIAYNTQLEGIRGHLEARLLEQEGRLRESQDTILRQEDQLGE